MVESFGFGRSLAPIEVEILFGHAGRSRGRQKRLHHYQEQSYALFEDIERQLCGNMLLKIKKSVPSERLKLRILYLRVERLDLDVLVAEHVFEHVFDAAFERERR